MRSLLVSVVAALLAFITGGAPAGPQDDAYPPRSMVLTISDISPNAEAPFDVTVRGCAAGDVIDFEFAGATPSVPCTVPSSITRSAGVAGAATQRFTAPSEGGRYTGTVSLASTDATIGTFVVDVAAVVPASMALETPLQHDLDWTPGVFSLAFVVLIAIAAAVGIRLRLLNE